MDQVVADVGHAEPDDVDRRQSALLDAVRRGRAVGDPDGDLWRVDWATDADLDPRLIWQVRVGRVVATAWGEVDGRPQLATAVRAETMNARPVRSAVTSTASRGARPRRRSSMKRRRISDVNSVQAATTNGPPTAVIGDSLRSSAYASNEATPTAMSTGTSDRRARTIDRSRTARKANTKPMAM